MRHVEMTRQVFVLEALDCLLQSDDVPFPRDVFFDGTFSASPRSRIPAQNAEARQSTQAIRHVVILNWPERIKTQPHDDRDNCFLHFDSKGPCGMTVNNAIDDDSATKHSDSHTLRLFNNGSPRSIRF